MKSVGERLCSAMREKRLVSGILRRWQAINDIMTDKLENLKYKKYSPYYNYLYNKKDCMEDNTFKIDEDLHTSIIKRIINSYKKAKFVQDGVPLAYKPSELWSKILNANYLPLIMALDKEDVPELKKLFSNFCRGTISKGLEMGADFILYHNRGFSDRYVNYYLRQMHIWTSLISDPKELRSLTFPLVGNPFGPVIEGNLIPRCSIRHYYFTSRLFDLSTDIKKPVICEIGGGFGGMAYYLLSNKDKDFKYINFDLPEMLVIISYFLMNVFSNKKILLFGEKEFSSEAISSNDIILMPNFQLPKLEDKSVDTVFNSDSLIEMDVCTIAEYLKQIGRICRRYFLHVNHADEKLIYAGKPSEKFTLIMGRNIEGTPFKRIYIFPSLLQYPYYYECLYGRCEK